MPHSLRPVLFLPILVLLLTAEARGQQPLDVGIHVTPQVRYITSSPYEGDRIAASPTVGLNGLAIGYGVGGYLEYAFVPGWSARLGLDFSYKRNHYHTERYFPETGETRSGNNLIEFVSMEVPLSVLHHFGYRRHDNRYLVGVSTTLNRWMGNPYYRSSFFNRAAGVQAFSMANHTLTVFGGYEHPISDWFVLSFEPYVAYVPSSFELETNSRSRILFESGLSVRMRLDN